MNRRTFMQSAGFLATSLAAQSQPAARPAIGIKTTLMREMLKGSIDEEFELAAKAGFQSVESLTQYAAWSDADIERVRSLCRAHGICAASSSIRPLSRRLLTAKPHASTPASTTAGR